VAFSAATKVAMKENAENKKSPISLANKEIGDSFE
jgi:hypothetical protein